MPTGRFVEIDETEILYSRSCHTPLMTDDLVGWMMYAICWIQANCKNRRTMEGLHKAVIALAKGAVVGSRLDNGAQYASLSISQLEKALGITRKTAIKYLNYLTLTGEYMSLKKEGVEPLLRKLQIGKSKQQASCYEYIWPRSGELDLATGRTGGGKQGVSTPVDYCRTGGENELASGEGASTGLETRAITTPSNSTNKTNSSETEDAHYLSFLKLFEKGPGAKEKETRREYDSLRIQGWDAAEIADAVKRQVDDNVSRGRNPYLYPHAFLTSKEISRWLVHAPGPVISRAGVFRNSCGSWCHVSAAGFEEPLGPPSMTEAEALDIYEQLHHGRN